MRRYLYFQDYLPGDVLIEQNQILMTTSEHIQYWWDYIDQQTHSEKRNQQLDSLKYALQYCKLHHDTKKTNSLLKEEQHVPCIQNLQYIQSLVYYILSRYGVIRLYNDGTHDPVVIYKR